jgi:hypothetical protein
MKMKKVFIVAKRKRNQKRCPMVELGFAIIILGMCGAILFRKKKQPYRIISLNGVERIDGTFLYRCDECKDFRPAYYWYGTQFEKHPLCRQCAKDILS